MKLKVYVCDVLKPTFKLRNKQCVDNIWVVKGDRRII